MTNPFATVSQQLVQIMRACPAMTGPYGIGVKTANIFDLTSPLKAQTDPVPSPTAGTTPRVLVLPGGGVFKPYGTNSRVVTASRDFLLCITTDTLRIGGENAPPVSLFSVEWAMLLAFANIPPHLGLQGLVKKYDALVAHERGLLDGFKALEGDTSRWTAVVRIVVEMNWGSYQLGQLVASITPS